VARLHALRLTASSRADKDSIQMRQLPEYLEAGIDFIPRQAFEALSAEVLHGKRAHHTAVK